MSADDAWENSSEFRRLCRLGIDPELPDAIIYLLIKNKVKTVEELVKKWHEERDGEPNNKGLLSSATEL
jgi:hypothetical protein